MTNTMSANVTTTFPVHFHDKKVRYKMDFRIFYVFLLVTKLLFIFALNYYHYN